MAGIKTELSAGHEVFYTSLYPPPHMLPPAPATDYVQRYRHKPYLKEFECVEQTDASSALELARRALAVAKPADEDKRYKCGHCAKSFKRNDHLKRHTITQHTETLAESFAAVADTKPFKCGHCDKSFKRNDILKRHTMTQHSETLAGSELWRAKRLNSDERAFKCPHCDSWYKRNDHLKRHVLSAHTDSPQMHYCPTCDKTFKRRDHLMRHMETKHTPENRRFRCADCREDFVGLENLVAHEQLAHGITPSPRMPCPHCEVTFKRRDHMIRHVNSKHLNQVVNCPLCPSIYKRRDHLIRHLREKHKTNLAMQAAPSAQHCS